MLAPKEENFVATAVLIHANRTHIFLPDLINSSCVEPGNEVVLHASLFHLVEHLLVKYCLKSLAIYALDGRFIRALVPIKNGFPLIIPVDKIQVVLARWVDSDRRILVNASLFRWVRQLVFAHSFLWCLVFASVSGGQFSLLLLCDRIHCLNEDVIVVIILLGRYR